jgi:DNA polymerase III alpha subunit
MAGVVRAHVAAKQAGLKLLLGAQFSIQPRDSSEARFTLVVLAQNLNGYGNLCQFITKLRRSSEKGTIGSISMRSTGRSFETTWCCCVQSAARQTHSWQPWAAGL